MILIAVAGQEINNISLTNYNFQGTIYCVLSMFYTNFVRKLRSTRFKPILFPRICNKYTCLCYKYHIYVLNTTFCQDFKHFVHNLTTEAG